MPQFERKIKRRYYCTKKNHVRKNSEDISLIREHTNNQMQEIYFPIDWKRDDLE